MISAKIIDAGLPTEDIVVSGTLEPYEKITGYCCPDFEWEVRIVFDDPNPAWTSYWGCCDNPDCPVEADDSQYRGVKTASGETIAEWLLDQCDHRTSNVNPDGSATCTWGCGQTFAIAS
jgi:hypothetical protein